MANEKIYIHEFIDIRDHARAKYMHHMTANWGPIGREERGQLCFGVWGTVGSTGRWPEVVNLWEEPGWDGLARNVVRETAHPGLQDPSLAAWWAEAAKFRRGGVDRILIPAPWTRSVEELTRDGVRGVLYAHELVRIAAGGAREYLDRVRDVAIPVHRELGLELVGAFRTAMRNDSECLLLWAIRSAEDWARFEAGQDDDPRIASWRRASGDLALDWQRILLVDAPLCPLRTGRQPEVSDRLDLDEIP